MDISTVYQLTPQSTTFILCDFVAHIEEFKEMSSWIDHDSRIDNEKIEIKIIWRQNFDIDGKSYWQLATAWFENKPFGVIQNAGRYGEGYRKAFWTDKELYIQAIRYLRSRLPIEEIPEETSLKFNAPELLQFHKLGYGEYYKNSLY